MENLFFVFYLIFFCLYYLIHIIIFSYSYYTERNNDFEVINILEEEY